MDAKRIYIDTSLTHLTVWPNAINPEFGEADFFQVEQSTNVHLLGAFSCCVYLCSGLYCVVALILSKFNGLVYVKNQAVFLIYVRFGIFRKK
jgi:hypothetical protein